jgi:hypothetical protein
MDADEGQNHHPVTTANRPFFSISCPFCRMQNSVTQNIYIYILHYIYIHAFGRHFYPKQLTLYLSLKEHATVFRNRVFLLSPLYLDRWANAFLSQCMHCLMVRSHQTRIELESGASDLKIKSM